MDSVVLVVAHGRGVRSAKEMLTRHHAVSQAPKRLHSYTKCMGSGSNRMCTAALEAYLSVSSESVGLELVDDGAHHVGLALFVAMCVQSSGNNSIEIGHDFTCRLGNVVIV